VPHLAAVVVNDAIVHYPLSTVQVFWIPMATGIFCSAHSVSEINVWVGTAKYQTQHPWIVRLTL
jgi:hypothetical protein